MNTILFDLDGTLLPMDLKEFERVYFKGLCSCIKEVDSSILMKAIYAGITAMVKNNGHRSNREVFAEAFNLVSPIEFYANEERFLEFYRTDFQKCADICSITPISKQIIDELKSKSYKVAVATNPIFPEIATYSRLKWLGLEPCEFECVTTYETSHYAKPNIEYYKEVLNSIRKTPEECIMIGNDVYEDGVANNLNIPVILVTDCLINSKNLPMDSFKQLTLKDVLEWAKTLPVCK